MEERKKQKSIPIIKITEKSADIDFEKIGRAIDIFYLTQEKCLPDITPGHEYSSLMTLGYQKEFVMVVKYHVDCTEFKFIKQRDIPKREQVSMGKRKADDKTMAEYRESQKQVDRTMKAMRKMKGVKANDDMVAPYMNGSIPVTYEGVTYPSLAEAHRQTGKTYQYLRVMGVLGEPTFKPKKKPNKKDRIAHRVELDGVVYHSEFACARAIGRSRIYVRKHAKVLEAYKMGKEFVEDTRTAEERYVHRNHKRPLILNGIEYESISDCQRKTGHEDRYIKKYCTFIEDDE